ncbi:ATP-binding cassette domain-containing protein [Vallicoccus soli]|uniref:ABC transporter ATP-binding protein n=1 Tax=Vallicoccus soli TaxID=2339232 RepID=A0A3A3Z6D2_9ACTN|nr:ABC transporter ATP-binding protein [Vallicoccus soli]RJK96255.1 ABC transporter ATP-binding protein [Vallicoccus soli]
MSPGPAPAAVLEGVFKGWRGVRALDDVTVALPEGAVTGLLGRNGAGKSTLLRLLAGHALPDAGTVRVGGRDPYEQDAVLAGVCLVSEAQRYPDWYEVRHVLAAAALLQPRWDGAYARRLAEELALPPRRRVGRLSRGTLSALGVVVGLAARAPLTLFDEPYLGLDAVARRLFYDRLLEDVATHPRTVVLSTHLIDEVGDLLEHVVLLDRGRVLLDEPAEDLRRRAVRLLGPAAAVGRAAAGRTLLADESLGGTRRAVALGALDEDEALAARAAGVALEPVPLQELIVRATAAGGAPPAPPLTPRPAPQEVLP